MIRFLLKRVITSLILLLVFVSALFFIVQIILPGDYVSHHVLGLSLSETDEIRRELGLDLPIWQRYFIWLSGLLRGDLGTSFSTLGGEGPPVIDVIKSTMPVTVLVFGLGTVIAFYLGLWLGKISAWRGPGITSSSITFVSIALYTTFPPLMAYLMVQFVAWRLGIPISVQTHMSFATPGMSESGVITKMLYGFVIALAISLVVNKFVRQFSRKPLPGILFLILFLGCWWASWYLFGIQSLVPEIIRMVALPTITYVLLSFGEIMLIMRTSMVDTLHEDYIYTARAKGLIDRDIRDRHAARNALLPVTSRMVISLPFLLSGMVMIERVMNIQGIGTTLFYAVGMQDIPLAMGAMIVIGFVVLASRIILEILQAALDPRVRVTTNS